MVKEEYVEPTVSVKLQKTTKQLNNNNGRTYEKLLIKSRLIKLESIFLSQDMLNLKVHVVVHGLGHLWKPCQYLRPVLPSVATWMPLVYATSRAKLVTWVFPAVQGPGWLSLALLQLGDKIMSMAHIMNKAHVDIPCSCCGLGHVVVDGLCYHLR